MYEITAQAQGSKLKAGAQRRIAVTMDEALFLLLRSCAVEDDRSISAEIVRRVKRTFQTEAERKALSSAQEPISQRGIAMVERLGDAPIEPAYREQMNSVARAIDGAFNGAAKGKDRKVGFVLLVFPFEGHEGRANYISNGADRRDIAVLFKEQIARFEGQPEITGRA